MKNLIEPAGCIRECTVSSNGSWYFEKGWLKIKVNHCSIPSRQKANLSNTPTSKISRDFLEKGKNDCSKTAEISKISRGCKKKNLK